MEKRKTFTQPHTHTCTHLNVQTDKLQINTKQKSAAKWKYTGNQSSLYFFGFWNVIYLEKNAIFAVYFFCSMPDLPTTANQNKRPHHSKTSIWNKRHTHTHKYLLKQLFFFSQNMLDGRTKQKKTWKKQNKKIYFVIEKKKTSTWIYGVR